MEITTCVLGKVEEAFSVTPFSAVATLSCCALRSFVPVCIIMWLGAPSWSSDRRSSHTARPRLSVCGPTRVTEPHNNTQRDKEAENTAGIGGLSTQGSDR